MTTAPLSLSVLLNGQMKYMKEAGIDVIMISSDGKERASLIAREQCPHYIFPLTRTISPLRDVYCLVKLVFFFLKIKPDIVHTHTPKAGLVGMLAAAITGIPIRIHTVAGLPLMTAKGYKRFILTISEKLTYASAHEVWVNSLGLKGYIEKMKFTGNHKIKMIGYGSSNGINVKKFSQHLLDNPTLQKVKASVNYNEDSFYFLFVGRVVKDKGIEDLVTAFRQLTEQNPQAVLLIIGPLELIRSEEVVSDDILSFIKNSAFVKHIEWSDEIEYYMKLADVFVFPSYREGFPNVILQAGAMKKLVIASNIPGNSDIIVHNKTGLLFPAGNVTALYQLMLGAIKPALENNLPENLFDLVVKRYDQEFIWKELFKNYERLSIERK